MNKFKLKRISSLLVVALSALMVLAVLGNVSATPTYSNLSVSSTAAGSSCVFTATFNDSVALNPDGQVIFGTNNTGAWFWSTPLNFTSTPETVSFTMILNSNVGYIIGFMWNCTDNAGTSNSTGLETLTVTQNITPSPTTNISYESNPVASIFWFITLIVVLIIGAIIAVLLPSKTAGAGVGLTFGLIGIFGTAFFANAGVLIVNEYTNVNTGVTNYTLMPIGLFILAPLIASILCMILPFAARGRR